MLLERERADRFGKARASGYQLWTRKQGDKFRTIKNEQTTEENNTEADPGDTAGESIEDKFNR